jgi:CDP-L-myo-inositol myo-inositolphosphotransferase
MRSVDRAVILLSQEGPVPSRLKGPTAGKLLGLTLLERAVLAAARSGVRDFILIGDAGTDGEKAVAGLRRDLRVRGLDLHLELVSVSEMGRFGDEGRSDRPFWLIPADLVFDPQALAGAAQAAPGDGTLLHLVDRHSLAGQQSDDGIGLTIDERTGRAAAFVRSSEPRSAAYAGISLCPATAFSRLAATFAEKGGIRLDADTLSAAFPPLGSLVIDAGAFCRRVTTKASLKEARRYLLGTARKPTDAFFARHINRPISLLMTRFFLRLGITPNPLSIICLAIGLVSGWLIAQGGYLHALLGAFLFEFASIFDGCDGEVARLTFRTSKLGGFLDMVGDAVIFVLFFLCLPIGLYRSSHRPVWLVLGVLALLSMGAFYLQLAAYMKRAKLGNLVVGVVKDIERSAGRPGFTGRLDAVAAKIAFIYRRDFFSTLAFVVIGLGGAAVLMAVLAVFMPLEPVYMYFYSRRRFRT